MSSMPSALRPRGGAAARYRLILKRRVNRRARSRRVARSTPVLGEPHPSGAENSRRGARRGPLGFSGNGTVFCFERGLGPRHRCPGRPGKGGRKPPRAILEGADEALDPLVVALEGILAEDRLALRIVELEIDPIYAVILALQVRLADELPAQAGPRALGRGVLGDLDGLVRRHALDEIAPHQAEVQAAVGADVV